MTNYFWGWSSSVEISEDLATSMLAAGLLMIHDTERGSQDDEAELTGGQQVGDPLLHIVELDVKTGRDDTALVQAAVQLNDNLASAVVVDDLELTNVA